MKKFAVACLLAALGSPLLVIGASADPEPTTPTPTPATSTTTLITTKVHCTDCD